MIDSHVHLNRHDFADDRQDVLQRAARTGISGFLNIGYDLASSWASVRLAESDPRILASVGIHPHDASCLADRNGEATASGLAVLTELRALARSPRVVAIGEIGLDFFRDLSPRPAQQRALIMQLELAKELDLPVVLHIREAHDRVLALLADVGLPPRGAVLHSFAGEIAHARWALDHGCLLGIGGPVTYKGSRLPQILKSTPVLADDMLLETDAPWLPPAGRRGRRNEPAYMTSTRDFLADLLGVSADEVALRTTANFLRLFGRLPGPPDGAEPR
jgi:TatD DNase family protein